MRRTLIICVALAFVVLVALYARRLVPEERADGRDSSATVHTPNSAQTADPLRKPETSAWRDTQSNRNETIAAQMRELMTDANRPVSFFGRVVDQHGNPIPGVKVGLSVRYMKDFGPALGINDTFDHPKLTSDADGRFALLGAVGAFLTVESLEKPGYEPSAKAFQQAYWYWRDQDAYQPDPGQPETFQMWKLAGAEKLIRNAVGNGLSVSGSSTHFDLIEGKIVESGGDITARLIRKPEQIQWGQRNYEWTIEIIANNGGILQSADEQMYRAPETGYQDKLVIHMPANERDWTDSVNLKFYITLRSGRYFGRVEVLGMVGSARPVTPFRLTTWINPSGSRNLGYNPLQNVISPVSLK